MTRRATAIQLLACSAIYLAIATRGGTDLLRTQFANHAYSDFFDVQAGALLDGHLAIPPSSIGLEAFVVDGSEHMYFGLFPALLRMPLELFSDALYGELTVVSSFIAWLVFVTAAWRLGDAILRDSESHSGNGPTSVLVSTVWRVSVALGTPMLMLAGPAWVFSEAIMWGVAAAVVFQWRLYVALTTATTANHAWVAAALLFAVLNRPTLGLGCVLVLAAVAGHRLHQGCRREAGHLAGATAAGAMVLVLPNLLRFGRLLGPPMESQLLSQTDEQRMRMLEYAGGDFVDPRYLPTNAVTYLRPDGISVSGDFPFIGAPQRLPTVYLDAVHDITYRTPSLIATSTALVLLALVGVVGWRRAIRTDPAVRRVGVMALVGVPAAATLLIWGFIAPRYLADFVVILVPVSALGCPKAAAWFAARTPRARRLGVAGLALVAAWSVAANSAIALSGSYLTGPDGGADALVELQGRGDFWTATDVERFSSPADFEFERTDPPTPGTIARLGACDAVYLSTGEPVDPWIVLDYGSNEFRRVYSITSPTSATATELLVARLSALPPNTPGEPDYFELWLVTEPSGTVRLDFVDDFGVVAYPLDGVDGSFTLSVTSDPVLKSLFFDLDGRTVHFAHYLTRSLFGEGGQRLEFSTGETANGLDLRPSTDHTHDCSASAGATLPRRAVTRG